MNDLYTCRDNFIKYRSIESRLVYGEKSIKRDFDLCILIPTFKRDDKLIRAIKSAFFKDSKIKYKIIVVDNDYRDIEGTELKVLLEAIGVEKIAYYQNKTNIGQFGNWNRCIELSESKWIAMLHDDDYLMDDYFYKIINILDIVKDTADVGYIKTRAVYKNNSRNTNKGGIIEYTLNDLMIMGPPTLGKIAAQSCGALLNRDALMEIGGFNEDLWPDDDAYLVERLIRKGYRVFRTRDYFGLKDFEDAVTYRRDTGIQFAKNYINYIEYYKEWGRISRIIYLIFKNEIDAYQKKQISSLAYNNNYIKDKKEFIKSIDEIIGEVKKRPIHQLLYKLILIIHSIKKELERPVKNNVERI